MTSRPYLEINPGTLCLGIATRYRLAFFAFGWRSASMPYPAGPHEADSVCYFVHSAGPLDGQRCRTFRRSRRTFRCAIMFPRHGRTGPLDGQQCRTFRLQRSEEVENILLLRGGQVIEIVNHSD